MTTGHGHVTAAVVGIFAGAVIGAALGVLYAPQAGERTRRQMRHYSEDAQRKAVRFGHEVKDNLDRALEYGKAFVG